MTTDRIDAMKLLAEPGHDGDCCACCIGYCPAEEGDNAWAPTIDVLVTTTVGVQDYVGSRLAIVRADLLDNLPDMEAIGVPSPYWATIPETKPPTTTLWPTAPLLDRVLRAGLTVHEGTETVKTKAVKTAGMKALHLYLGDLHVGWTMPALKGAVTPDELVMVRTIASECGIGMREAAVAMFIAQGRPAGQ